MSSESSSSPAPRPGAVTGVAWLLAFRVLDRLAGVISFLVLARLLLPEHFGVIALATAVIAFIEVWTSLGLDTVLIQIREPTRAHYDTAWTIQVMVAAGCAVLIAAASHPASLFFREPRLFAVLNLLAVSFVIEGFQNIRLVDFRREMRFDKEFLFLAIRRLITVCVTIAAALVLRDESALAIGMLVSRLVGTALSYLMRPYRPHFTLVLSREFAGKSSWLLLSGIVLFLRQRSADFALGRLLGTSSVGAYTLASDLSTMVTQELAAPINRVALSDLSAQRTREDLVKRFDAVCGLAAVVLTPLGVGLSACATLAVSVLFGPAWGLAGQVLQFLAIANLISSIVSSLGVPLIALGHYRFNFICHAVGAASLIPMLVLGIFLNGPIGAAVAVMASNVIVTVVSLYFAKRAMGYGLWHLIQCIWRPLLAGLSMFMAMRLVAEVVTAHANAAPPVVVLLAQLIVGALTYPSVLALAWKLSGYPDGAERRALGLLRRAVGLVFRRMRPAV